MLRRLGASIALTVLVVLLGGAPVIAGGWAGIALDAPPEPPVAGETLRIGFTVLQHGHNPVNEIHDQQVTPDLNATNRETADTVRVEARQQGAIGHFVVDVTLPSAGTWEWRITPDPFPLVTDAAVIDGYSHTSGTHQEAGQHSTDLQPVTEFAPLTVPSPPAAILGVELTDAARVGSLVTLAAIAAAGAWLVIWRRGSRATGTRVGAYTGRSVRG
jgi:hypothetical protein